MITKKLVGLSMLLVASLFTTSIFQRKVEAYQLTGISSNDDINRHRVLLWVYNAEASTALANGTVVQWTDGSLVDGLEVIVAATADSNLVAGVAIGAVAAVSWGFIQTHGYHSAIKVATATSAADALSVGSTAGQAKTSATAGLRQFAAALEATTSSTTVKGFIRL